MTVAGGDGCRHGRVEIINCHDAREGVDGRIRLGLRSLPGSKAPVDPDLPIGARRDQPVGEVACLLEGPTEHR